MLYFYLTEGCNLRCRHCWINPKYQSGDSVSPSLDFEFFCHIIRQARPLGLNGVKLTGGEPLIHPEIDRILTFLRSEEIRVTVETNGVLCTKEIAKKICQCKNPFVSVSLDGADAQTHEWVRGVEGSFEAAIQGIRNLVTAGLRPQVIMTVMRRNRDQTERVVRLAESLGAGSVKFNTVQPIVRGEYLKEAGESLRINELVELGRWVENILSNSTKLRLAYSHPPAFKPLSNIFAKEGDGCGICKILNIIGVLSDGSYAMCGIGETVPDLVFGRAERDCLEDVWNDTPLLLELRKGLPERLGGICGSCVMKRLCLGNCIAQNYYSSKNLWAPFWYCEEARNEGLFPQSRWKETVEKKQEPKTIPPNRLRKGGIE